MPKLTVMIFISLCRTKQKKVSLKRAPKYSIFHKTDQWDKYLGQLYYSDINYVNNEYLHFIPI
jgi:hypothetical protein